MKQMRKAARQKDEDWALNVFDRAPFVTMSMIRPDGTPYGLPLSLIRGEGHTFYFHCADEGEKMDCIRANPIVSLSAVSRCSPKFETGKKNFTMYYDSAIALGEAEIVTDNAEKLWLCVCSANAFYLITWGILMKRSSVASTAQPLSK